MVIYQTTSPKRENLVFLKWYSLLLIPMLVLLSYTVIVPLAYMVGILERPRVHTYFYFIMYAAISTLWFGFGRIFSFKRCGIGVIATAVFCIGLGVSTKKIITHYPIVATYHKAEKAKIEYLLELKDAGNTNLVTLDRLPPIYPLLQHNNVYPDPNHPQNRSIQIGLGLQFDIRGEEAPYP